MDSDASNEVEPTRFEPGDVPPFVPLWLGAGLASFVVGVLLIISVGFPLADRQEARGPLQPLPAAPRLETAPNDHLAAYRAAKQRELGGKSDARIEAAMAATASQGWTNGR